MNDYPPDSNFIERGGSNEPKGSDEYIDDDSEFKQLRYETETINSQTRV